MDRDEQFLRRDLLKLGVTGGALAALAGMATPVLGASPGTMEAASGSGPWAEFSRLVAELGNEIAAPGVPDTEIDRAEGYRLFARYLTCGLDKYLEFDDPAFPAFYGMTRDGVRKYAGDNPDELYSHAAISAEYEYRIAGNMNETLLLECGIYSGDMFLDPKQNPVRLLGALTEETLKLDGGENFEIFLGGARRSGNWLPLPPKASSLLVRRYLRDPWKDRPRPLSIERLGGNVQWKPLTEDKLRDALIKAAKWARMNVRIWADYVNRTKQRKFNVLVGFDDNGELGAPAGHKYLEGYWSVPAGKALVLSFEAPKAKYWNMMIGNYWMESLEWRFHNMINYNNFTSAIGSDGKVTYVISHVRPARKDINWFETLGHFEGQMTLRSARSSGPMPKVDAKLVDQQTI